MKCPHAELIVTNPQVCNHPDLFEPRPTVSPFYMEGIEFHTASLVLKALPRLAKRQYSLFLSRLTFYGK